MHDGLRKETPALSATGLHGCRDTERGFVLDARCCFEQPRRFLHAQHVRQLAWVAHHHQHTGQTPPRQRHQEQESQRRDRAVDNRRPDAVLMLMHWKRRVLPKWVGVNNQTVPESADDHRQAAHSLQRR